MMRSAHITKSSAAQYIYSRLSAEQYSYIIFSVHSAPTLCSVLRSAHRDHEENTW